METYREYFEELHILENGVVAPRFIELDPKFFEGVNTHLDEPAEDVFKARVRQILNSVKEPEEETPDEVVEPMIDGARNFAGGHYFRVKNILLDGDLIQQPHIRKNCTTGPYRIAAYMILARRANGKQQCWGSISDIVRRTGMCWSTAVKALADLEFLGLVKIERRFKPDGSRNSHLYTLLNKEIGRTS